MIKVRLQCITELNFKKLNQMINFATEDAEKKINFEKVYIFLVNIKTTITVFYYLYRELLPKVKVPTKLARLVRWLRATFPIQIERNIYNGIFCPDMLKTYQRQIKLLAFLLDRNREEFKIKKKKTSQKREMLF